jgi:hypothetical protein
MKLRATCAVGGIFGLLVVGGLLARQMILSRHVPSDSSLKPYVMARPAVPVVFTSRSHPRSFEAAAPEAEGFTFPGTVPWAAEGRLRLLDTNGEVYELTWGRTLPDGGTLIDVTSPTVSLDGSRILFAGRKAPPDPGRWRLYQVAVTGENLAPLTGGPEDAGCVELPPLRYAADGSVMSPESRKRVDYDDIDPTDCGEAGIAFASSRLPDLGRDHSRRATQVWLLPPGDLAPRALSANRNNDRWPFFASGHLILFSSWSRNREAVTADRTEVRPVSEAGSYATAPTDQWMAARVMPDGSQFGYAVKIPEPVWRPRPLFNGRVVFMTASDQNRGYRIAQADWGFLRAAPSSLKGGGALPTQRGGTFLFGPDRDATGRPLSAGCPSPAPGGEVLFSAAHPDASPGDYGLYTVSDNWSVPATPRLLFDDPNMVDAEPVAVYPRPLPSLRADPPQMQDALRPDKLKLASGQIHTGALGLLENRSVDSPLLNAFPGQQTDTGAEPVVPHPTGVKAIAVYAAHRDRFDDPVQPRLKGTWEKLIVAPIHGRGSFRMWIPADPMTPTVLAGLDESGRVFEWVSPARDAASRSATFLAIAGDHYSGTRPNGYHFCVGCHTGHTFFPADIRER